MQKRVSFGESNKQSTNLGETRDKSESPFASGPPSSEASSYNRLKKLDSMEVEPNNLQPSTSKQVKQKHHMEIEQENPYHPLILSSTLPGSHSQINSVKSEVTNHTKLKEEEDPFGLFPKVSFLKQGDISLIQLPSALPSVLSAVSSTSQLSDNSKSTPVQSEQNENSLPITPSQGYLGKLLIFKSGKMKLQIGEFLYDVTLLFVK